jgi:hypothetical protein
MEVEKVAEVEWGLKSKELRDKFEEKDFRSETIELAFEIIEHHPNDVEKCRAAVVLTSIVQKGLGTRASKFSKDHPELPGRVHELISSNFMRMEVH